MQIIIPMAGRGSRFVRAGYQNIKPLIEVDGRPIIEHIVGLFPGETDFLFICASDHLKNTELRTVLKRIAPTGKIVEIEPHKLGPVHTVLVAKEHVKKNKPVLVSYCDYSLQWDWADFCDRMKQTKCVASVPAYRGFHPHSLGPNLYAYLRTDGTRALEIKEKGAFTANRMQEYASAGLYYFASGEKLCHYFEKAVARDLKTNGEFYASLPINLVLEDKQPVEVYELPYFLQWGTPEDLEEYQGWSDYFAGAAIARIPKTKAPGTLLLPMAGLGERFKKEGYAEPKPFVSVGGTVMLKRVLDSLPSFEKRVLVCRNELELGLRREKVLQRSDSVVLLAGPTDGAVSTCLAGRAEVSESAPLFIAACDSALQYDETEWATILADEAVDFVVFTFLNHPHANRNPKQYAWVKTDGSAVTGLACKVALSETPAKDAGVTGAFWFRRASDFWRAAETLKKKDIRVNGEFYVDSVISLLVDQKKRGVCFTVDRFLCFGTPDDVRTFEYWQRYSEIKLPNSPRRGAIR